MAARELERVLAAAADAGSLTAARALDRHRWSDLGASDRALWGRCRGSGARPYETVVDVRAEPAYACTCPSRRHPCKHALELMLLGRAGQALPAEQEPPYVRARLAAHAPRPAQGGDPKTPLVDPEAARERLRVREERVARGLDELERWLTDQIRGGLAGLQRAGYAHFDAVAARMVDAQAPGVASALRAIPGELVGEGWPERALTALAGLHLLVSAHRRLDALPASLAATVRSRVGYPVSKDRVLTTPPVRDRWRALGLVDTVELQLETRRVWLRGERSGRWGMWLSFAPPGQALDDSVLPGQAFEGDLHFYPGSGHRVLLGERFSLAGPVGATAEDIPAVSARFATLLAEDPWATRMPALVRARAVPPGRAGDPWWLRDAAGWAVPLERLPGEPWPLLAHSVGWLAEVFGEWNGRAFRPLSVLADGQVATRVAA